MSLWGLRGRTLVPRCDDGATPRGAELVEPKVTMAESRRNRLGVCGEACLMRPAYCLTSLLVSAVHRSTRHGPAVAPNRVVCAPTLTAQADVCRLFHSLFWELGGGFDGASRTWGNWESLADLRPGSCNAGR